MTPTDRSRKHKAKKRAEKYGADAPDQRGKHRNHARGATHPRWNPDRMITSHGYVAVRVPAGHPHRWGAGYAYEHIVVAMSTLGRPLEDDEIVHHTNGTKDDNRPENLEVLSRRKHGQEHAVLRGRDNLGRFPPEGLRNCRAFP